MSFKFEELDYQQTELGAISLRRRAEPRLDGKILYEVKLGEEFLMSSLFTEAEIQLARLALAQLDQEKLDVVVGGLGLGYTAAAVLEDSRINSLTVIELMQPVINWHQQGLLPLATTLTSDLRCKLVQADFFELASSDHGNFNSASADSLVDAILLDIDHSPSHWLDSNNQSFYTETELRKLTDKLRPGGVFGLWSNEREDLQFTRLLQNVFETSTAHPIIFPNPYTDKDASNTVYIAKI